MIGARGLVQCDKCKQAMRLCYIALQAHTCCPDGVIHTTTTTMACFERWEPVYQVSIPVIPAEPPCLPAVQPPCLTAVIRWACRLCSGGLPHGGCDGFCRRKPARAWRTHNMHPGTQKASPHKLQIESNSCQAVVRHAQNATKQPPQQPPTRAPSLVTHWDSTRTFNLHAPLIS